MDRTLEAAQLEALRAVWGRLHAARSVSLLVRDGDSGAVQAQGTGSVTAETSGGETVVIRERGRWTTPRGAGAHFTDALRWTLDTEMGALRLEQVRRGPDEAVPLLELVPDLKGDFTPLGPYLCGDDRYDASVHLAEGALVVTWRVTGPRKNQEILRRYR